MQIGNVTVYSQYTFDCRDRENNLEQAGNVGLHYFTAVLSKGNDALPFFTVFIAVGYKQVHGKSA